MTPGEDSAFEKSREAEIETPISDPAIPVEETDKKLIPHEFSEICFKYLVDFCRSGRALAQKKVSTFNLWDRLDEGNLTISEWENWPDEYGNRPLSTAESRKDPGAIDASNAIRSQYVHSPTWLINHYVAAAYASIFEGEEPFVVNISAEAPEEVLDGTIPDPYLVQKVMMQQLERGLWEERIKEILRLWVRAGTCYAKVFMDGERGDLYPCVQVIPLENVIPDALAKHGDVNRFRLIGHTVPVTYDDIISGYLTEKYTLNKEKFTDRWGPKGGTKPTNAEETTVGADPDVEDIDKEPITELAIWEVHGKVPTIFAPDGSGYIELMAFLVSELDADQPEMIIELDLEPYLPSIRRRPFPSAQFTPRAGVFGTGLLSVIHNLLFDASQSIGQVHDVGRRTANCAYLYEEGSITARWLDDEGHEIPPGSYIPFNMGSDPSKALFPAPIGNFNLTDMLRHIDTVLGQIERNSLSDTYVGVGKSSDTATGANLQQAQSQRPVMSQLQAFAKTFLKPLGEMVLAAIFEYGPPRFWVKQRQPDGTMKNVPVDKSLLNPRWYTVDCSLSKQDQTKTIRAQILKSVITEALPVLEPKLQQVGIVPDYKEFAFALLENLGFDRVDRFLHTMTDREGALTQQVEQLTQQLQQMAMQMEQMSKALNKAYPAGPPGNGNGQGARPPQGATHPGGENTGPFGLQGGPMGDIPTDENAELQFQQLNPELHGNIYES